MLFHWKNTFINSKYLTLVMGFFWRIFLDRQANDVRRKSDSIYCVNALSSCWMTPLAQLFLKLHSACNRCLSFFFSHRWSVAADVAVLNRQAAIALIAGGMHSNFLIVV
jgi:hypothetical protein